MKRAVLVGIAGGSGAGKSWLAERLALSLPGKVTRVSLDSFYRDRSDLSPARRRQVNYDHPRAIDWKLLREFLKDYRNGRARELPCYDFRTHCRNGRAACEVKPILVVEGLWTLSRQNFRCLFDLAIYVDCPREVRLQRRLARDICERGRGAAEVRAQFRKMVSPMHNVHVAPQRRHADIVVEHPVSEFAVDAIVVRLATIAGVRTETKTAWAGVLPDRVGERRLAAA